MNTALDSRARFEAAMRDHISKNPGDWNLLDGHDGEDHWAFLGWQAAIASMAGWQPIETAPKDGREFLAVYGRQGNCMELARWCPFHSCWKSGGSVLPGFMNNATAWQPLPAPPTLKDPPIAALAAKETT